MEELSQEGVRLAIPQNNIEQKCWKNTGGKTNPLVKNKGKQNGAFLDLVFEQRSLTMNNVLINTLMAEYKA